MNSEQFGKRLKSLREILKLSQAEVGERLSVPQTYIYRLENGNKVNSDFFIKVLSFYGQYVSMDRLFNEKLSVMEICQDGLNSPTSDLLKNRAAQVQASVNELLDQCEKEVSGKLEELRKRVNARMDVLGKL